MTSTYAEHGVDAEYLLRLVPQPTNISVTSGRVKEASVRGYAVVHKRVTVTFRVGQYTKAKFQPICKFFGRVSDDFVYFRLFFRKSGIFGRTRILICYSFIIGPDGQGAQLPETLPIVSTRILKVITTGVLSNSRCCTPTSHPTGY